MAKISVISLLLLIVVAFVVTSAADKMNRRCRSAGGTCIKTKNAGKSCAKLPYECGKNAVCCRGRKSKRKGKNPRKSCPTRKKCWRNGGTCIKSKTKKKCKTVTANKLCRTKTCTCCLGDHPKCGSSDSCTSLGGFCITKKKAEYCKGGTKVDSLCSKKKCSCCLMKQAPAPDTDCACGQANTRVVGGEEVSPANKYPWVVGLVTPFISTGFSCGGAIINSLYILTAAHCLYNPTYGIPMRPNQIKVGLAVHTQFSSDGDIEGVTEFVKVDEVIIHENYDYSALPDDIGLLKLKVPLDFTAYDEIQPSCLPTDDNETYEGYNATVVGWGRLDYDDSSSYPDPLMEVTVPVLSPACEGDLPSYFEITDSMLCAGLAEGGKDACIGDSGGPLVVSENGAYTLIGIVSFGDGCAEPNIPGVYTRVTEFLDWIATNTKDANYCPN